MYYKIRLTHYFDVWGNEKDGYEVNDVYKAICYVSKSNTDFDIGFDYLFEFMSKNPNSETTKRFIEYYIEEMHAPKTHDGRPEFTYLIGKDFVSEHWVSEEDMNEFKEYLKERKNKI